MQQMTIQELIGDESNPEYDAFVEKFKPKKTTDDCYTPPLVYEAVADWVAKTYGVEKARFVRPFYPGGDYEAYAYQPTDIVVDNPPFSIVAQIANFYCSRNIPFFVFVPGLTGIGNRRGATTLAVGVAITYENGAEVNTSFLTNLEQEFVVRSCPELYDVVKQADQQSQMQHKKSVPKYKYPDNVVTLAQMNYMSAHGVGYGVRKNEAVAVRGLDAQRAAGKKIFGGGLLVSEKAAAEKAAAAKAAAEKADAMLWELSAKEKDIVAALSATR